MQHRWRCADTASANMWWIVMPCLEKNSGGKWTSRARVENPGLIQTVNQKYIESFLWWCLKEISSKIYWKLPLMMFEGDLIFSYLWCLLSDQSFDFPLVNDKHCPAKFSSNLPLSWLAGSGVFNWGWDELKEQDWTPIWLNYQWLDRHHTEQHTNIGY